MIQLIIIVSLVVLFLHVCTWEGMILEPVAEWLKHLPDYIKKPLYDCPICMSPWWGSIILGIGLYSGDITTLSLWSYVCVLFAAAGLNTLLIYIISLCKDYVIAVKDLHEDGNED